MKVGVIAAVWLAAGTAAAAPLIQQVTVSGRTKGDEFGWSAAHDGESAVVSLRGRAVSGLPGAGMAVTLRRAGDTWTITQMLDEAASVAVTRQFGHTTAIGAGLMAIGAPGANATAGAVYLYHDADGAWVLDTVIADPQPTLDDKLGASLAISGATALIGVTPVTLPASDMAIGTVRVFEYDAGWQMTGLLQASDGEVGNRFGFAVAIQGDVAVVGAPGKDSGRGVAYVFTRTGESWTQTAKLAASDRLAGDLFGTAVAISGDSVLVGAYAVLGGTGAAYVFERAGEAWVETQVLTAPTPMVGEAYGIRVALSGAYAMVVGSGYDNQAGFGPRGGGYIYGRLSGGYALLTTLRPDDGVPGDYLGVGAAMVGGVALLGAPYDDANTVPSYDITSALGAAYVFRLSQGIGEACTASEDCADGTLCCDEACALACEAAPTSSGADESSSGGGSGSSGPSEGEGTGSPQPPSPELEPLSEGCGCRTLGHVPGVWVLVSLLATRRRRWRAV